MYGVGRVYGTVCDVSDADSVVALSEFAKESVGTIHYWWRRASRPLWCSDQPPARA